MSIDTDNVVKLPVAFKVHPIEGPRKPLTEFGKLARRHGDAFDIALVEPSVRRFFHNEHVCDTLRIELAHQITGLAEQIYSLSEKAKSYGELPTCINLRDSGSDLELISAILSSEMIDAVE